MHACWKIPRSPGKEERNSLDRQMRTQTDTDNRKWKTDEYMHIAQTRRLSTPVLDQPMYIVEHKYNRREAQKKKQVMEKLYFDIKTCTLTDRNASIKHINTRLDFK